MGKALLKKFGITPFSDKNLYYDLHDQKLFKELSKFMEALYAGRSEVRIRHQLREVILVDFKSQYPSVFNLRGLQEFLLADKINFDSSPSALARGRNFVETIKLSDLRKPDMWRNMPKAIVKINPSNGDILPVRSRFTIEDDDVTIYSDNVGLNEIMAGPPAWYAIEDAVASKFLSGRTPEILECVELIPRGRQLTEHVDLFGREDFRIDPATGDNIFTRIIDLRASLKGEMKGLDQTSAEYKFLDAQQSGMKEEAISGACGVNIEFIIDEHEKSIATDLYYGGNCKSKRTARSSGEDGDNGYKAEEPGEWFAPFGIFIPASGRLLLAVLECLAKERGLDIAHCDTDGATLARPLVGMSPEEFHRHVDDIVEWFQALNPYCDKSDPFLKIEDFNYRLRDNKGGKVIKGEYEPLYIFGVSAKRYGLANIEDNNTVVIRKASAYGLGNFSVPEGYEPQSEHIAAPLDEKTGEREYGKLVAGSAPRVFADLWRIAFETALDKTVAVGRFNKDASIGELREASKQLAQEIDLRICRLPG
jgi:hypothetical protein